MNDKSESIRHKSIEVNHDLRTIKMVGQRQSSVSKSSARSLYSEIGDGRAEAITLINIAEVYNFSAKQSETLVALKPEGHPVMTAITSHTPVAKAVYVMVSAQRQFSQRIARGGCGERLVLRRRHAFHIQIASMSKKLSTQRFHIETVTNKHQ